MVHFKYQNKPQKKFYQIPSSASLLFKHFLKSLFTLFYMGFSEVFPYFCPISVDIHQNYHANNYIPPLFPG